MDQRFRVPAGVNRGAPLPAAADLSGINRLRGDVAGAAAAIDHAARLRRRYAFVSATADGGDGDQDGDAGAILLNSVQEEETDYGSYEWRFGTDLINPQWTATHLGAAFTGTMRWRIVNNRLQVDGTIGTMGPPWYYILRKRLFTDGGPFRVTLDYVSGQQPGMVVAWSVTDWGAVQDGCYWFITPGGLMAETWTVTSGTPNKIAEVSLPGAIGPQSTMGVVLEPLTPSVTCQLDDTQFTTISLAGLAPPETPFYLGVMTATETDASEAWLLAETIFLLQTGGDR